MTPPPSPGRTPRSGERHEPSRQPAAWIAAAVIALLAAGAVIVWLSPVLGVREIDIAGTADDQVIAQVKGAIEVADGTPLARLDTERIAERAETVPDIATAVVQRNWPRTLTIEVTLRTPLATTEANGQWWMVDAEGVVFGSVSGQPPDLVPLRLATPGPHDRATAAALSVLTSLDDDIRRRVAAITATAPYDVRLELGNGRIVIWGSAEDAAAKNEVLPALLKRGGTVIDISDPTLVTVSDG